jgi:crotonobetainyl-CoA:carnitine CoA-transferase CaiB-like acyl-CoA transferase
LGLKLKGVEIFKDLKVLELASVLAGPSVGQFFAELGAEVFKVENVHTGGDVTRSWKVSGEQTDDRSSYFCSVNWGKKSIALDLNTSGGKDIIQQLARRSDVIIASYKPGDAEKLGVDYKTLASKNPALVYGQVTGYGPANPRLGYDAVIQAEAGFMFMNGEPGGASLKMPVALIDVLAGHQLKEGLLLALLNRERTGKGDLVEVSLIQAAVSSLVNQATNWLVAGKLPQKKGSAHPNIAPYGDVFITADNQEVLLAVGSDRQFQDLCKVLGIADLAEDPRYHANPSRVEHRLELNSILQARIGLLSAPDLMEKIHRAKIPAGIIQNLKQVFEMTESDALVLRSDHLSGVRTYVAHSGILSDNKTLSPPPHFGQHTAEILQTLR